VSNNTGTACRTSRPHAVLFLTVAVMAMFAGCSPRTPWTDVTSLEASTPAELQNVLLSRTPDLELFRLRGPFHVRPLKDVEIRIAPQSTVNTDLYLCETCDKAPLVILLHGYGNSKDDHIFQALHLATWGMHAVTVDLPNEGPWIGNGRMLARLVEAVRRAPEIFEHRIETQKIILVGHSFGATAVAAALAEGAAVSGAILLDPAGIGRQLPAALKKVSVPVMLIGADEEIWPTRNRSYFYRFIPREIAEISIRDAVHEDAQYPTDRPLRPAEGSPIATEEAQITFVSALTAAAFSLNATGGLEYAWTSYEGALASGRFFNARRK
jgi:pimeloyl-ACP methyl ester carboxylesterase